MQLAAAKAELFNSLAIDVHDYTKTRAIPVLSTNGSEPHWSPSDQQSNTTLPSRLTLPDEPLIWVIALLVYFAVDVPKLDGNFLVFTSAAT